MRGCDHLQAFPAPSPSKRFVMVCSASRSDVNHVMELGVHMRLT